MRKIKKIILHHTASLRDKTSLRQIKRWHEQRDLGTGIQYHYVIRGNGNVTQTRNPSKIGHHCWGKNEDSLGVALTGNFENEIPSDAQLTALDELLAKLCRKYELNAWNCYTHKMIAHASHKTLCPGKHFQLSPIMAGLSSELAKDVRPKLTITVDKKPNWWENIWETIREIMEIVRKKWSRKPLD